MVAKRVKFEELIDVRLKERRCPLATQRITIAKLGGISAEVVCERLKVWTHEQLDAFADELRMHALSLPVLHFVEWVDRWSMGDVFERWLTPPGSSGPLNIMANRYEVFAYNLPDDGRLERHLTNAGNQQWPESNWFVQRLLEATQVWNGVVERSVILVLRMVTETSISDEEVTASLVIVPNWIST